MTQEIIRDTDGNPIAATCTDQPLTDETRHHLGILAEAGKRLMVEEDPLGLRADRQRIALDRVHRRETPACADHWPGDPNKPCERPQGHQLPHIRWVPGGGVDAWQPDIDTEEPSRG